MRNRVQNKAGLFLMIVFILAVFLLAFNKVHDADAWMHLSFGRLLFEMKGFPENELFVYPSFDKPFSYSSWLFGLTSYLVYLAAGVNGLVILKAITVSLAFFILFRDSLRPYNNYFVTVLILTLALLVSQHRFILRPDIFLMVLLSFSIFSLNAFLYSNKKYVYALPLSHMLWANSHSSITLMFVPFLAFIAGGLIQRFLSKRGPDLHNTPSNVQLGTISLVFLASFMASLVSPYFISQYAFGSEFLMTDWFKQEIVELLPPKGWDRILLSTIDAIVVISFLLNRRRISLINLFLIIPFMILPFIAVRFEFLLAITAAPVVIRNLSAFLEYRQWHGLTQKKIAAVFATLWIALFCSLTMAKVRPFGIENMKFGVGFDYVFMPKGAVDYMDERDIYGKVFNTFHFGQYIIWRSFPERTVLIDGRGYVSTDLLEQLERLKQSLNPQVLDGLYEKYGFESLLIFHYKDAESMKLRQKLDISFSHPQWALVYWDDISMLFLRRGSHLDSIIERDEYRFINPTDTFKTFAGKLDREKDRENALKELGRAIRQTDSLLARLFLGFYYYETGSYEKAINNYSAIEDSDFKSISYSLRGDAYKKIGNLDKSLYYYKKALRSTDEEDPTVLYMIGVIHFTKGDYERALSFFIRALERDESLLVAYPLLIGTYQALGKNDEAEDVRGQYAILKKEDSKKNHFDRAVKAYHAKDYEKALAEYERVLSLGESNEVVYTNIGYVYYDTGTMKAAHDYFIRALSVDPEYANAHYGLALVYKRQGNSKDATHHLKEYIRIEPAGYFSRRAKKEIELLSR